MAYKITLIEIMAVFLMIAMYTVLLAKLDLIENAERLINGYRLHFNNTQIPDKNCSFVPPTEPTIILRIDDIQAGAYTSISKRIINDILVRNMTVSLAVIPKDIGKDKNIKSFLISVRDKIEMAPHGYTSVENEFENLTKDEADILLKKAYKELYVNFDTMPITFIPPNNVYSSGTVNASRNNGFSIISGPDEYRVEKNIAFLGFDVATYDYQYNKFITNQEVINKCKDALVEKNFCVIMIHPQDFIGDEERYKSFTELLDSLNIPSLRFKNFKDFITCEE